MKTHMLTMLIGAMVCASTWWLHREGIADEAAHVRYYVWAILLISGIVTLIIFLRLLTRIVGRSAVSEAHPRESSPQPRRNYRLRYEGEDGPLFVQRIDDRQTAAAFTCPVRDISETGISLACTGEYALGEVVQGEVIFASGRTAAVNGAVVREDPDRICLQLQCTIDPSLLMTEQREQILSLRGDQARPGVAASSSEIPSGSLPSHRPKGICRLK